MRLGSFLPRATAHAIVLSLSVLATVQASAQNAEEVLKNIQDVFKEHNSIAAVFEQTLTMKSTGRSSSYSGVLYMKGMDKFKVEVENQVVVSNGKTIWTYNAESGQLIIDNVREGLNTYTPRDFLFEYPKEYDIRLIGREGTDGEYLLELLPNQARSFITSIKLWIDGTDWIARRIEYVDINGNITKWDITEIDLEPKLKDSFFSFKPPIGANVVDFR